MFQGSKCYSDCKLYEIILFFAIIARKISIEFHIFTWFSDDILEPFHHYLQRISYM